jgi:iron complex transport system permease protein
MSSATLKQNYFGTRSPAMLAWGLVLATILVVVSALASISLGAADITPIEVWNALFNFNHESTNHLIIRTLRLPRSLIAIVVGASLAIAGAIMQGLTGNPLASPSILGVSAGAAFAVVLSTFLFGINNPSLYAGFALAGGALIATLVYIIASLGSGGITPLNLTLAGTVFTTLVSTLTATVLIISQETLDQVRFWLAGSLGSGDLIVLGQIIPYLIPGFLIAIALSKQLTTLTLGETIAQGLGQNTAKVKILGAISAVLLVGGSVAIAGPIGFIGLMIPHFVRFLVGVDYRWIIPYAACIGAILLLLADIIARLLIRPLELPVGLVMPIFGTPFFLYLIRSRIKR